MKNQQIEEMQRVPIMCKRHKVDEIPMKNISSMETETESDQQVGYTKIHTIEAEKYGDDN